VFFAKFIERNSGTRRLSQFENVLTIGQNAPEAVIDVLKPLLLKASRPSALFPVTQHMTFGTLKTIGEVGLICQMTFRFSRFDDCEWFTALRPFLSTIRQPAEDFADQAWSRAPSDHVGGERP
jgi:LacI family transcriptional regulator